MDDVKSQLVEEAKRLVVESEARYDSIVQRLSNDPYGVSSTILRDIELDAVAVAHRRLLAAKQY
jgi:hypothetical protein